MPSPRTVSANGIEIFLLEQGEREFEHDVDATMRTVFGRGFSAAPRGGCRIGSAKPTCPVSARRADQVNAALLAFLKENADQAKAFAQ